MTTDSMILGTPFGEHPTRILMLGSGELGRFYMMRMVMRSMLQS